MPPESASASSSTAPAPDAGAAAAAPQRAVEAVPFTWSGHTKEGAWACMEQSGVGQCPAGQQVQPDGEYVGHAAYPGNLTAVDLAMTWQADPTQTGLVLAVYGNTTSGRTLLAWAQGDSPLHLSLDAAGLGLVPDGALMLMVWPEGKTATSPSVFVDATQQAFTVDGTLSVRR
jgi:hypothetical protein